MSLSAILISCELTEITVRSLFPLEERPGVISLLAGKPNNATFPITSLQFTTRDPSAPSGSAPGINIELTEDELAVALQYSATAGLPELRDWVYALQEFSHGRRKGEGWQTSIGAGSQDLIFKVVFNDSQALARVDSS